MDKKLFAHEKRIEKLEINHEILFNQLSYFQMRDIYKNIIIYFADHLNVYDKTSKSFNNLLKIMDYLSNDDDKIYSLENKKKLIKFFQTIFFLNFLTNSILHNHLSTKINNKIENVCDEQENDSIIPYISFNQLFVTLKMFLEKNVKNDQLQIVIKELYKEYLNDDNLGKIKDEKGEAIKIIGEKIEEQLDYPGIIRITAIRENKLVEFLR